MNSLKSTCPHCGRDLEDTELYTSDDCPRPPPGYTTEELERDNPYNQWMYED